MDNSEPYFEWVPDDFNPQSQEDIFRYALGRVETQWHQGGWDQPFTVGVMFRSNVPELSAAALSICTVPLPPGVVEDPDNFPLFARLITQAVYQEEYQDDSFQRILLLAAVGHSDQNLDGPRDWMRHILRQGGDPIGWFSIAEGFNGDVAENVSNLDNDQIRALPGVTEARIVTFVSADRYVLCLERARGTDQVQATRSDSLRDGMEFALNLLVTSALRMKAIMDDEVG
jgi:hypothetical protein